MPTYDFKNKETGDVFEKFMKISEKDQYLLDNSNLEQTFINAPSLGDPTKLSSTRKFDSGFKEVLQKIHARAPGSTLNRGSSQL